MQISRSDDFTQLRANAQNRNNHLIIYKIDFKSRLRNSPAKATIRHNALHDSLSDLTPGTALNGRDALFYS